MSYFVSSAYRSVESGPSSVPLKMNIWLLNPSYFWISISHDPKSTGGVFQPPPWMDRECSGYGSTGLSEQRSVGHIRLFLGTRRQTLSLVQVEETPAQHYVDVYIEDLYSIHNYYPCITGTRTHAKAYSQSAGVRIQNIIVIKLGLLFYPLNFFN